MSSFIEKNLRYNYTVGVLNGAIFGFVDALAAPSLTMALFVTQLGGSSFLVGLLSAIYNGGWFVPQFFVSHRLAQLPLKKPIYLTTAIIRIICLFLVVVSTYALGAHYPTLLLAIFFILMTIYSFSAGFAGNAFMTIVAKVIPMQMRGSFFGWREFTATAMGLFAGYLVAVALSPQRGLVFPDNFGILFVLIFGSVGAGLLLFVQVREPREVITGQGMTFVEQWHTARGIVRENHLYRRYLLTRFILAAGDLATPFYAIYATKQLGAPDSIVGLYIGLTTFSALLCNPILNWLSDHRKLDWILMLAAAATPIMPLLALLLGLVQDGSSLAYTFGLVFIVYGIGRTAANISFPTYLLNIAPPEQRSLYIGFTNTTLGIATFIPIIGGTLLDLFGFPPLFIITFIMSSIGLWLALGLRPKRAKRLATENLF
ncbi:MAG TPA: MFS transporter [Anaerolineae bacterium]|nr:MFS transporter [Anaerolineae bacterium]